MDCQMRNNLELEQIRNDEQENGINNGQRDIYPINNHNTRSSNVSFIGRSLFQRLLILSTIRLVIYLNKLYQDCNAVSTYYSDNDVFFLALSIVALISPPIIYALYLVGDNLVKEEEIDTTDVTTKSVNGLLLIPWQIKRHLDVLHYVAAKICICRPPDSDEKQDMSEMQRNAEVLEFFEDFYAGFLQLLLQLYILMLQIEDSGIKRTLLIGELIGSALCILSMMIAVRRRDDGILTSFLSFTGWLSLYLSRVVVFTLVASFIGFYLAILCLIHALAMSIWIYSIAVESYHLNSPTNQTQVWTIRKRISVAIMVFLFFGLPSLLIWPIMFQLKEHRRPLIFLLIITVENILLLALWFGLRFYNQESLQLTDTHVLLVIGVVCATLLSVLFLTFYIICKPKLTDQVVLYEMRASNAESYGIYYEFCDLVFKLPNTHQIGQKLERVRNINTNL